MITTYEAPSDPAHDDLEDTLFLAGGITDCPDWQSDLIGKLTKQVSFKLGIFNPRRKNFDINDINVRKEQITWEHYWLSQVRAISFWFCNSAIQPITLLEFGRWSTGAFNTHTELFVGIEPGYEREEDVRIQLELERPGEYGIEIVDNLDALAAQIIQWTES